MREIAAFCLVASVLNVTVLKAQLSEGTKIGANTGTGLNTSQAGVFWNSPDPVSNMIGQFYIDSTWQEGNVKFKNVIQQINGASSDSLSGIAVRYNVYNDQLEVLADKSKNDIRVIPGNQLKSYVITSGNVQRFERAEPVANEAVPGGFWEILAAGKLGLVKHYRSKTIKPNYNPGFGTGEKNTIVSLATDYYVVSNGKTQKFKPGNKSVLNLMKNKESDVESYLKSNNPDFKSEEDLVRLFTFYNN